MGFIKQSFPDNKASLTVAFEGPRPGPGYTPTDSIQEALEYFNLYVRDHTIYERTAETEVLATIGATSQEELTEIRETLDNLLSGFDDETATEYKVLFKNWEPDIQVTQGERYKYNNALYRVLQSHTTQRGWEPEIATSLFAVILTSQEPETYNEWVQPDSTNPYMMGDRVIFLGKIYESIIDNNIWSPIAYPAGWMELE